MKDIFKSLAMGDYGVYVWFAYGMCLTALVSYVLWLKRKRKDVIARISKKIKE